MSILLQLFELGAILSDSDRNQLAPCGGDDDLDLVKDAAIIAAHVYGDKPDWSLRNGWEVCHRDFGIILKDKNNTGLVSNVYQRTRYGETEYIYATAGTDPSNINDWIANYTQLHGYSVQYQLAAENAKKIADRINGNRITFVGHSLGGGEAALNAMVTGFRAITFNAAGVSGSTQKTNGIYGYQSNSLIDAYIVSTDWLNALQTTGDAFLSLLPGQTVNRALRLMQGFPTSDLVPANGYQHYLDPSNSSLLKGHSMDTVLQCLGL